MRDLVLILFLSFTIPMIVRFPYIGIVLWTWMSLMNPHRMVYGLAAGASLNQIIAIVTLAILVLSRESKKIPYDGFTILLMIFTFWITLTTFTVAASPTAPAMLERNIKTIILVVIVMMMTTSRERLHALIWTIAISLGYYGFMNGALTLVSGGQSKLSGPPQSMIYDNNHMALAIIMMFPLLQYLWIHSSNRLVRLGLIAAMAISVLGVLGSYSRGGMIALSATLGYLWLRSNRKLATLGMVGVVLVGALVLMPTEYKDRIATIGNAQEDQSFQQRLMSWTVNLLVALDRPLGAGFEGPFQDNVWYQYAPDSPSKHAAHSVYFMVLGEHGFGGLIIYLVMVWAAWKNFSNTRRATAGIPELKWIHTLCSMSQVSIVGFMVGGAALSMAYYDGFLILLGISSVAPRLASTYGRIDTGMQVASQAPKRYIGAKLPLRATARNSNATIY